MQETRSLRPSKNPPDLPVPGPRRAARVAAWIATLLWLFVFTALFFHHSATPVLFGRFSKAYALGLLVLLLLTPAVYFLARAVFSFSVVTRADGTTFVVSPLTKVSVIVFSMILVFGLAQLVFPKRPGYKYQPHPFLQAVPLPDPSRGVNARGFRGHEVVLPKPPGLCRVVLLGGSTLFDPALRFEESFGEQLQRSLAALVPSREFDVQCAAVPAYNSEHSLVRYATDAIDLDADVVLVMHAINDLHVADQPPGIFRRDYGHFESIGTYFLHPSFRDRTRLVETVRFFSRYVAFSDFRRPNDWDFHVVPDPGPMVRNLRSIVTLGRSRGQHIVLCTQPNRFRLDVPAADRLRGEASLRNFLNGEPLPDFMWFCRYMAVFNDKVRALAAEEGLPLLDLERDVPPTGAMFLDDVHVTAAGARLEAELAASFLADHGLVR